MVLCKPGKNSVATNIGTNRTLSASETELLAKIFIDFKLLTIFAKRFPSYLDA